MKQHRLLQALYVSAAILALTAMGATYAVPIPAGTAISAHLVGSLSSSSASPGQTFAIVAAKPLLLQGRVVVFEGVNGQGHVVSVTQAGSKSKPSIVVQFDWILAADGRHLPIAGAFTEKGIGTLTFGTTGPFAATFAKAKTIEVGPDLVFSVYASSDQVVNITAGL
jgi:hypothetical protein